MSARKMHASTRHSDQVSEVREALIALLALISSANPFGSRVFRVAYRLEGFINELIDWLGRVPRSSVSFTVDTDLLTKACASVERHRAQRFTDCRTWANRRKLRLNRCEIEMCMSLLCIAQDCIQEIIGDACKSCPRHARTLERLSVQLTEGISKCKAELSMLTPGGWRPRCPVINLASRRYLPRLPL